MSAFKFTGVDHFIMEGAGVGYIFEYKDAVYTVECWATRNSGGTDIYNANGSPVEDLFTDDEATEAEFEQALEAVQQAYGALHNDLVVPMLNIVEEQLVARMAVWSDAYAADATKHGDSNDAEIEAWRDTAQAALSLLGMPAPDAPEPEED